MGNGIILSFRQRVVQVFAKKKFHFRVSYFGKNSWVFCIPVAMMFLGTSCINFGNELGTIGCLGALMLYAAKFVGTKIEFTF